RNHLPLDRHFRAALADEGQVLNVKAFLRQRGPGGERAPLRRAQELRDLSLVQITDDGGDEGALVGRQFEAEASSEEPTELHEVDQDEQGVPAYAGPDR